MPRAHVPTPPGQYDIYPGFPIGSHKIFSGFDELAKKLAGQQYILIDGYGGVLWPDFRDRLDAALKSRGIAAQWIATGQALHSPADIEKMVAPFLGGDDPIFGTRFTGHLGDFFDANKLQDLKPPGQAEMTLVYGCGAGLLDREATVVYVDIPKNEIQFRSRAGSITNLGAIEPQPARKMYKRFYFVDWVALNRHKADLLPRIDLIVDGQRPDDITFMSAAGISSGLISFVSARSVEPDFDLNARTRVQKSDIFLEIRSEKGEVVAFLSSQPPTDETNIVAMLALGVDTDELLSAGATGGDVGASILPSVLSGPVESKVETGLKKARIVDTFQFVPYFSEDTETTGLKMIVGKELFPKVRLLYATDLFQGGAENTVRLEQSFNDHMSVQGSVRENSQEANEEFDVGLDFEFKFDF